MVIDDSTKNHGGCCRKDGILYLVEEYSLKNLGEEITRN